MHEAALKNRTHDLWHSPSSAIRLILALASSYARSLRCDAAQPYVWPQAGPSVGHRSRVSLMDTLDGPARPAPTSIASTGRPGYRTTGLHPSEAHSSQLQAAPAQAVPAPDGPLAGHQCRHLAAELQLGVADSAALSVRSAGRDSSRSGAGRCALRCTSLRARGRGQEPLAYLAPFPVTNSRLGHLLPRHCMSCVPNTICEK